MSLEVGPVLVGLQGWVTKNGLWSSAGWGPKERVGAEPRGPNGQDVGAGQGLIYAINVVPRYTRAFITKELRQGREGESVIKPPKYLWFSEWLAHVKQFLCQIKQI